MPTARRRLALPTTPRGRLVAACLVLGAVNLGLWWQSDATRREALAAEVATARNRARAVEALRTQLAARVALRTEVLGDRTGGSLLRLLDELTRLVPDGAWLDSVEVRGGSVYVTGYAPAAAALIGLIERSPVFAEAQFRAPVVPDRTSGLERFDLSISLRGRS